MSSRTIANLLQQLTNDPWRAQVGFSHEVQSALEHVLDPSTPNTVVVQILGEWLSKYQPCLFGRIAAKKGLLSYCLISEDELADSDEVVARKIQSARREWTRLGFEGKASGFIIVLRSRTLATAVPDAIVKAIAQRVSFLYLQEDVSTDRIYLDQIYLEQPGSARTTWEWLTGVNYFSSQGDKRWWQDHRIPAGMAFSVNSVGHMVKSGKLARAMRDLEEVMETAQGDITNPVVDSLEKALELAMRTIALASDGPSGKATALMPRPSAAGLPRCPVTLPAAFADKDYCGYQGWYHTDYTLPAEYFTPEVERPAPTQTHDLDFTYLFDQSLDNPDFNRMGRGRIIRDPAATTDPEVPQAYKWHKRLRGEASEVEIDHVPRLREALGNH
jgi:hypothetical protein